MAPTTALAVPLENPNPGSSCHEQNARQSSKCYKCELYLRDNSLTQHSGRVGEHSAGVLDAGPRSTTADEAWRMNTKDAHASPQLLPSRQQTHHEKSKPFEGELLKGQKGPTPVEHLAMRMHNPGRTGRDAA
eukprot:6199064-Pleurochrysis_carterae.AAC.4